MDDWEILFYFSLIACAFLLGFLASLLRHKLKVRSYENLASEILLRADLDASTVRQAHDLELKQRGIDQQNEIEKTWRLERQKMHLEELRIQKREETLDSHVYQLEDKLSRLESKERSLELKRDRLREQHDLLEELQERLLSELEKVSGLTGSEARALFLNRIETQVKTDAANLTRKIMSEAEENLESNAKRILATAIGRLAVSCVSETSITTVPLPNDEMKGRIIGREGRNIRSLEQSTGVNVIIDDTPCAIVISGFDPVRKEIAKIALLELVEDGRIHPTSIEEAVQRAKDNINKTIKHHGEDAAYRAGAIDLHPELISLLGRLHFRYSYGQNILKHSLEVSYLMGLMAMELGLDVALAKRIGLLHDIGKALSHEREGSHALVGRDVALRCGESEALANGIGCHHGEILPLSIEASLCSAADAISASRPGARIEAVEDYTRRLKSLEEIAREFPGVLQAFALQAGREIRVIVSPDAIDDDGIQNLARDLAHRIEQELSFPGKIKITIIREKRCVEYAL